ncbi:uncharacterized protein LOC119191831, partial [Manduca sexta]|uniref:uncharacterized protein LOC119191831 n=1 Tax=Manduca sexta TaxID=7130 RepID=UPI00188F5DD4
MGDLLRTGRPKSGVGGHVRAAQRGFGGGHHVRHPDLARRVQGWRVLVEEETLSDHRYIRFSVSTPRTNQPSNSGSLTSRRWGGQRWATRLNREAVKEAALVQAWFPVPAGPVRVEEEAECYARPAWLRAVDSPDTAAVIPVRPAMMNRSGCFTAYKTAKRALRVAIAQARPRHVRSLENSRQRPVGTPVPHGVEQAPPVGAPLTQSLRADLVTDVVAALFPAAGGHSSTDGATSIGAIVSIPAEDIPEVSPGEL